MPRRGEIVAALLPAAAVGIFYFGVPALGVLLTAIAGCAAAAAILERLRGRSPGPAARAAALTGFLLGLSLPPASPLWMVGVGCAVAVFFVAFVGAGIGLNPFHPVPVASVCLLLAFPAQMALWSPPIGLFLPVPDGITAATPLSSVKAELLAKGTALAARNLDQLGAFVGRMPGGIGETSALALLLGGAFLLWRGVIGWEIPATFLGSVAALAAAFSAIAPARFPGAAFHILAGGLIFGAFFVAADRATAPVSTRGRLIYGGGCGLLTWLIRSFGAHPEGVAFAILLMSSLVPLIDADTRRSASGGAAG